MQSYHYQWSVQTKKISSKTHESQVLQLETKLTPQKMF